MSRINYKSTGMISSALVALTLLLDSLLLWAYYNIFEFNDVLSTSEISFAINIVSVLVSLFSIIIFISFVMYYFAVPDIFTVALGFFFAINVLDSFFNALGVMRISYLYYDVLYSGSFISAVLNIVIRFSFVLFVLLLSVKLIKSSGFLPFIGIVGIIYAIAFAFSVENKIFLLSYGDDLIFFILRQIYYAFPYGLTFLYFAVSDQQ